MSVGKMFEIGKYTPVESPEAFPPGFLVGRYVWAKSIEEAREFVGVNYEVDEFDRGDELGPCYIVSPGVDNEHFMKNGIGIG